MNSLLDPTLWSAVTAAMATNAPAIASALIAATWKGLLLAAAVALCLRLLPGIPAAARSLVWTAVFLLVMLLHFAPRHQALSATPSHGFKIDPIWSYALASAWAMLSLLRGIQLVRSAARLRQIARQATPVKPSPACAALLHRLHRSPVQLCTSPAVDRPSVVGFFSPRILLPPALLHTLAPAELEQIVLHETEHLRRADDWTNLVQKLGLVLFPLNPALLWVERRLCTERELACDDGVLRQTHARKAYALCLTKLAEQSILRRGASLALGAWERQSELARRVHRILRLPDSALSGRPALAATSLLVLALLASTAALTRTPDFIHFAQADPSAQAGFQGMQYAEPATLTAGTHFQLAKAIMPTPQQTGLTAPVLPHRLAASARRGKQTSRGNLGRGRAVAARRRPSPSTFASPWILLANFQGAPAGLAEPTGLAGPTERNGAGGVIGQAEPHRAGSLAVTVQQVSWHSYAAVPYRDGWLIIQL